MPIRNLIVTGTAPAAPTAARTIARRRFGFSGIAAPPPRRVTLRTGTAEVQVEVIDQALADQPAHRLARVVLVDRVELEAARLLARVEAREAQRLRVALDERARGDHLGDVQAGAEAAAQRAERRIGDARHRRQHHGRLERERPDRAAARTRRAAPAARRGCAHSRSGDPSPGGLPRSAPRGQRAAALRPAPRRPRASTRARSARRARRRRADVHREAGDEADAAAVVRRR